MEKAKKSIMTLSENFFHYGRLETGFTTVFWMWLGFIMPVQLTAEIFGSKKWNLCYSTPEAEVKLYSYFQKEFTPAIRRRSLSKLAREPFIE